MRGTEHWTTKGEVRLFLWRKAAPEASPALGTVLFVHGSSTASQPAFDLHAPGRPHSSVMEWFAPRGFDTWCLDNEGYGRSDKQFCVMPGISHASFQQKNYLMVYQILHAYFSQPEPAYRG